MAGGGKSVKAAQMACASENAEERLFKGVQLLNHGKSGIHAGQFLTALADNLKARLSVDNSELISHLQVLEPASWPKNESRIIYGEQIVVTLAKRLKLDCRPTI